MAVHHLKVSATHFRQAFRSLNLAGVWLGDWLRGVCNLVRGREGFRRLEPQQQLLSRSCARVDAKPETQSNRIRDSVLGNAISFLRSTCRATSQMFCGHILGTRTPRNYRLIVSGPEASQSPLLCNDKSGDPEHVPPRPSQPVDIFSSTSMPLWKLTIKVPLSLTIALWLSSLATALLLTVLSGELRQFQWLLLATLTGSLLQACCISFGGTISFPRVDAKLGGLSNAEKVDANQPISNGLNPCQEKSKSASGGDMNVAQLQGR
jgi:hypothetical protein